MKFFRLKGSAKVLKNGSKRAYLMKLLKIMLREKMVTFYLALHKKKKVFFFDVQIIQACFFIINTFIFNSNGCCKETRSFIEMVRG